MKGAGVQVGKEAVRSVQVGMAGGGDWYPGWTGEAEEEHRESGGGC